MTSKVKKRIKYNKDIHPPLFFTLCQDGLTLTQIAVAMKTSKETLHAWTKEKQKHEWQAAWVRGREAGQAFWESKYQELLIAKQATAAAQMKSYLMNQYAKDWAEKLPDQNINHIHEISVEELRAMVRRQLNKAIKADPDLRLIGGTDVESSKEQAS